MKELLTELLAAAIRGLLDTAWCAPPIYFALNLMNGFLPWIGEVSLVQAIGISMLLATVRPTVPTR